MCGIVGMFDLVEQREIDRSLLSRMNESQFHRGPDEGGLHCEPGVGLGHRRLSIIDLASGQQPLFNEDHSVVVVFNGEIYNFQALAKELQDCGHQFRTHSDTEVIVHAWEEWGVQCVQRLRGMFAFAIWDRNQKTLFIARDRIGIKPLYYAKLPNNQLLFGSELKSLLTHTQLPRELDPLAIEEYFTFGYVPDPKTILKNVYKLPPAHYLLIKHGSTQLSPVQYWDVPFTLSNTGNEQDLQQELIERLYEAVNIRLIAEVPLGAFLSGGVDSSAVVAMMAKIDPSKPVNTCSIAFGDPRYNETQFAQLVADQYKTNHRVEQVDPNDFALLDQLAGLYDEPFADSSAIPTYRVCELAKQTVTVALSGDGGDENFAGYRRHRWHMIEEGVRQKIPAGIRASVFGMLGRYYPKLDWAPKVLRGKSTFQSIARNNLQGYMHSVSIMNDDMRQALFTDGFRSSLQGYNAVSVFERHAQAAPTDDPLSLIQYLDMKTYLPGDILTKVDRASMAHALEVRVPIIDHEFLEWVSDLPARHKLRGAEGKYIFKRSLEPYLPNDVLYRDKMGFAVPISNWFRGELRQHVRDKLLSERLSDSGFFNMNFIEKMIQDHQSGRREHSAPIWSLLMFEASLNNVIKPS